MSRVEHYHGYAIFVTAASLQQSSYSIQLNGGTVYAGIIAARFSSITDAELAALTEARSWIDARSNT